jgi:hypothetical protein
LNAGAFVRARRDELFDDGDKRRIGLLSRLLERLPHLFLPVIALSVLASTLTPTSAFARELVVAGKTYELADSLGHGYRGEVFSITGQPLVAKIAHADSVSRTKLTEEVAATKIWETAAAGKHFRVSRVIAFEEKTGVALKELVRGDTFATFLIRHQLAEVMKDGVTVRRLPPKTSTSLAALKVVGQAIEEILKAQREGAAPAISLSPNNIMISYVDELKSIVSGVHLVDLGPSTDKLEIFNALQTMDDYVTFSVGRMTGYIAEGLADVGTVSFAQAQAAEDSLTGRTLTGEKLKIYGLTGPVLETLRSSLRLALRDNALELYFYGSRVMPRTEVIKRDAVARAKWPVHDDGVRKDSIRISGITRHSDLDVLVVTRRAFASQAEQDLVRHAAENAVRNSIRSMPISLYISESLPSFLSERGMKASRHQIVGAASINNGALETGTCHMLFSTSPENKVPR